MGTVCVPLAWLAFAELLNTDGGIEEGRGWVGRVPWTPPLGGLSASGCLKCPPVSPSPPR